MPRQYLRDLSSGSPVAQTFIVRAKALRAARNGTLYIELELADRSGSISARIWNASRNLFDSFDTDAFVEVIGHVETYREQLQMVVNSIKVARDADVDPADFFPTTERDVGEMLQLLQQICSTVEQPHLRALLDAFFDEAELCDAFCKAPAAVRYHHATLGGLLEHTLSVAELAVQIAQRYPSLDADLLAAGAILHDIGKIDELAYSRSFNYTDAGQLVGHLTLGLLRVEQKAAQIDGFPAKLLDSLRHLILSHHGEYQFGSPKLPMTLEAVALHHLDNLDAKLNGFQKLIDEDLDPNSAWTEWSRMFERRLYKGYKQQPEGK